MLTLRLRRPGSGAIATNTVTVTVAPLRQTDDGAPFTDEELTRAERLARTMLEDWLTRKNRTP